MNNGVRTLVIIFPETRAFDLTFDLFQKNVLDVLNADLCLCVKNDDQKKEKNNGFYKAAKYTFICQEPIDWSDPHSWGKALDYAQRVEECRASWRKLFSLKELWLNAKRNGALTPNSPIILLFFRWYLKRKLLEEGLIDKYDWFIITRSDFMHHIPHIPMQLLDEKYIWIPNGEDYGGITDRHMVVSRKYIADILSIPDSVIKFPNELFEKMKNRTDWDIEGYLKFALDEMGLLPKVKRFPYAMYAVRSEKMRRGWHSGKLSSRYSYYIKYINEYKTYFLTSKFIKEQEDWNETNIRKINNIIAFERRFFYYREWPRFIWYWYLSNGILHLIGALAISFFISCAMIFEVVFLRQRKPKEMIQMLLSGIYAIGVIYLKSPRYKKLKVIKCEGGGLGDVIIAAYLFPAFKNETIVFVAPDRFMELARRFQQADIVVSFTDWLFLRNKKRFQDVLKAHYTKEIGQNNKQISCIDAVFLSANLKYTGKKPYFFITKKEEAFAKSINCEYLVFHTDAGPFARPRKNWINNYWQKLIDMQDKKVVLVGESNDKYKNVVDLRDRTTLGQLAAVVKNCLLYVGLTSGPFWLARLFDKEAVIINGGFEPPILSKYNKSYHFFSDIECSPCMTLGECSNDKKCMQMISPKMVNKKIQEILKDKKIHKKFSEAKEENAWIR